MKLIIIAVTALLIYAITWGILYDELDKEQQQVRDIKMDRILRYCKESPICNQLDKDFEKFSSGINVGRFE